MLDIEFLLDAAPHPRNHVVYVYHSGSAALRRRVWDRVNKWAEGQGITPINAPSVALSMQIRVFPLIELLICRDLKRLLDGAEKADIEDSLNLLVNSPECRVFLMVPAGSYATTCDAWPEFLATATVIEEPLVTERTLQPILAFLMDDTKLYDFARLENRQGFLKSFYPYIADRPHLLAELIQQFTDVVLTQIDDRANRFNASARDQEVASLGASSLERHLRKFLSSGGEEAAYKLVIMHFDKRLHQHRDKITSLVAHLQRVTAKLLAKEGGSAVASHDLIYWAALLIAWDERLLRGPFAVAIDGLCRAYRASPSKLVAQRMLEGSWGVIARHIAVLQTKGCRKRPELQQLVNALAKRIDILPQLEDVPLLGRLERMFEKDVKLSTRSMESPDKTPPDLDKLIAT
jgi:hypothetical protein